MHIQGLPVLKRHICCLEQKHSFICFVQVDTLAIGETELRQILAGSIQHPGQPIVGAVTSCLALEYSSLNAQLQRFRTVEEFHSLPKTTQELECESRFQTPTATNGSGRFVVPLSRKSCHEALAISYVQTFYRFQQLEKRLQHQSDERKNYADVMKE